MFQAWQDTSLVERKKSLSAAKKGIRPWIHPSTSWKSDLLLARDPYFLAIMAFARDGASRDSFCCLWRFLESYSSASLPSRASGLTRTAYKTGPSIPGSKFLPRLWSSYPSCWPRPQWLVPKSARSERTGFRSKELLGNSSGKESCGDSSTNLLRCSSSTCSADFHWAHWRWPRVNW